MKLEQAPKFQPITITIETAVELDTLWGIMDRVGHDSPDRAQVLSKEISDWISQRAQIGGA